MGELIQLRIPGHRLKWIGAIPEARRLHLVLLFLSHSLFLWMFLSSESLERGLDAGRFGSFSSSDAMKLSGYRFASQWRHGMTGNSPLYMPGFFLVSAATWIWAFNRRPRQLILEGVCSAAAAGCVAWAGWSVGAARVIQGFESAFQTVNRGDTLPPSVAGIAVAFYTLFTWTIGMISSQRALARRSLLPMLLPVGLTLVLAQVRPWTVNDFTTLWLQRAADGEGVALLSLIAIPVLGILMVLYQFRKLPGLFR